MQDRVELTPRQINEDLLRPVLTTPRWFWPVVVFLGLIVLSAAGAFGFMVNQGLGITGLNRPVMWGFMITNFVFWVGISHAGVMISSILRLAQAEWRRPVTRAAEVLTVLALTTAALFPVMHVGRPWRVLYWPLPYDFSRGIWPNIRSPLIWDPAAIGSYLSGSVLFIYTVLIPDLAVARDRTTGWRHTFYSALALGWRGTTRQWRLQGIAGLLLSALILPVFVSVHSIVSWDFAVTIGVQGWHATIFAPYFVLGAILSGVSAVVSIMALMRWLFHWDKYILPDHFDALGRLLVVVGFAWFYLFFLEFSFGLLAREPGEVALRNAQVFEKPWGILFAIFIFTAFIVPVAFWFFKKVRRNIKLMFALSLLVNIGMWMERFLIIVPGLARKQGLTFSWGTYRPSPVEMILVAGSFALVLLGMLLFAKFFPIVPLYEQKEAQIFRADLQVGDKTVPAVVRE